jgi:hypothetical protein
MPGLRAIFLLGLGLSGCSTTEHYFESYYDKWLGSSIEQFKKGYGEPSRIDISGGGNRVYVYKLPKYIYCTIFWEVNQEGTIIDWRHEGSDCRKALSL